MINELDMETVHKLRENVKYLQEIADKPEIGKRLKKRCLKIIEEAQRDIKAIETGAIYSKKAYCEYCGELYNPDWTWIHGNQHLLLTTKRYDSKTGQRIR